MKVTLLLKQTISQAMPKLSPEKSRDDSRSSFRHQESLRHPSKSPSVISPGVEARSLFAHIQKGQQDRFSKKMAECHLGQRKPQHNNQVSSRVSQALELLFRFLIIVCTTLSVGNTFIRVYLNFTVSCRRVN